MQGEAGARGEAAKVAAASGRVGVCVADVFGQTPLWVALSAPGRTPAEAVLMTRSIFEVARAQRTPKAPEDAAGGEEEKAAKVAQFKKDHVVFKKYQEYEEQSAKDREILERHQMNHTASKQAYYAVKEGPIGIEDYTKKLEDRWSANIGTQAIEDMNNIQKNAGVVRGAAKYRRPARSLAVTIKSKLLKKRHKFKPLRIRRSEERRVGKVCRSRWAP